ncbi:MAG TPA: ABC transporter substrate-binding protein [Symbiobacteriaceae bacterium]|nr:ABC transporter substrate-binding protein [Symbiobacteriaceae bacterium]
MRKLGLLLLAASLVLTTACSKPADTTNKTATPTETPKATETKTASLKLTGDVDSSKTLTTLLNIEPPPAFHGNVYDDVAGLNWSVQPFLFESLADYSPLPNKEFKPSGLESFKLEGSKLTIVLKKGLKWSDGSALTMDDVMTGFYMGASKGTIWQIAKSITKTDANTIVIEFVNNSPLNQNIVLNSYIMTPKAKYGRFADDLKAYIEKYRVWDEATKRYKFDAAGQDTINAINKALTEYKPDPLKDVLFSGPYTLTAVTSSEALFTANPNYRIKPKVEKIRGLRSAGGESFTTAVLQQQYTIENGGLSPEMTKQVNEKFKDTLRTIFVPEFSQMGFMFNNQKYPFTVPEVRKALAYMVDRETLVKVAEPGSFVSDSHATGMLPSLIPAFTSKGFVDKLVDYKYDPAKAEKLLTSIGWKKVNGKWANEKGEVQKIEISTIGSWPSLMYPSEAYSTMLKEAGWDVEFKPMEFAAFVKYMNDGAHGIANYFIPSMTSYQHPWEIFNGTFTGAYATRMNLPKIEAGKDRIVKAPTSGKEYNVTQMNAKLYEATSQDEIIKVTEELMTLTNDLVLNIPLIEKTAPFRIYDPKMSVADGTIGKPQNSFYYYGNLNQMLAKMLRAEQLFFVK